MLLVSLAFALAAVLFGGFYVSVANSASPALVSVEMRVFRNRLWPGFVFAGFVLAAVAFFVSYCVTHG